MDSLLYHENILQIYGYAAQIADHPESKENIPDTQGDLINTFTVTELVKGNIREEIVRRTASMSLDTYKDILELFVQICAGVEHLHEHNIVHTGLDLYQILMTRNGRIKIRVTGTTRALDEGLDSILVDGLNIWGTYSAPEVVSATLSPHVDIKRFTKAIDVYSFGMVMWSCLNFREKFFENPPEAPHHEIHFWNSLLKQVQVTFCPGPQELVDLIEDCTKFDQYVYCSSPQNEYDRPSISVVKERLLEMLQASWANEQLITPEKVCCGHFPYVHLKTPHDNVVFCSLRSYSWRQYYSSTLCHVKY